MTGKTGSGLGGRLPCWVDGDDGGPARTTATRASKTSYDSTSEKMSRNIVQRGCEEQNIIDDRDPRINRNGHVGFHLCYCKAVNALYPSADMNRQRPAHKHPPEKSVYTS